MKCLPTQTPRYSSRRAIRNRTKQTRQEHNHSILVIDETNRRRAIQEAYNREHGITPQTVRKAILELGPMVESDYSTVPLVAEKEAAYLPKEALHARIQALTEEMKRLAEELEFERAAEIRDQIRALQMADLGLEPWPKPATAPPPRPLTPVRKKAMARRRR